MPDPVVQEFLDGPNSIDMMCDWSGRPLDRAARAVVIRAGVSDAAGPPRTQRLMQLAGACAEAMHLPVRSTFNAVVGERPVIFEINDSRVAFR